MRFSLSISLFSEGFNVGSSMNKTEVSQAVQLPPLFKLFNNSNPQGLGPSPQVILSLTQTPDSSTTFDFP